MNNPYQVPMMNNSYMQSQNPYMDRMNFLQNYQQSLQQPVAGTQMSLANQQAMPQQIGYNVCPYFNYLEVSKVEELKNKFIEAIKSIDFNKLNIYELKTVSEISDTVDKMAKKDYTELLKESMVSMGVKTSKEEKPKTIGEMK